MSEGSKLAGNVFLPETWKESETLPTIVVVTPAGAVRTEARCPGIPDSRL